MKMERAQGPVAGTVAQVNVRPGQSVEKGQALIVIERPVALQPALAR
jgi:biotin carboxyl carrier protein